MDLVNRLKYYMETSKVTISQFADTCGIPRPTMSQLMNGRNKRISDEVINKIHNGFPNLSILWLMFGEGQMELNPNIEISEPQNNGIRVISDQETAKIQANTSADTESSAYPETVPDNASFENSLFEANKTASYHENYNGSDNPEKTMPLPKENTTKENILFDTNFTTPPANDTITPQVNPYSQFQPQPQPQPQTPPQPRSQPHPAAFSRPAQASPLEAFSSQKASRQALNTSNDITRTLSNPKPTEGVKTTIDAEEEQGTGNRYISISPDAHKKITNIVVFYSDNSFQSFIPDA